MPPQHIHDQSKHHAYDDHGCNREKYATVFVPPAQIPRQLTEPAQQAWRVHQYQTYQRHNNPYNNQ